MPRWVAIFEDITEAEASWVRKQHAEDHFAYLATNRDKIILGGGLRPNPGEWYCGELWILHVGDRDEAVALCVRMTHISSWGGGRAIVCTCGARRHAMEQWNFSNNGGNGDAWEC